MWLKVERHKEILEEVRVPRSHRIAVRIRIRVTASIRVRARCLV